MMIHASHGMSCSVRLMLTHASVHRMRKQVMLKHHPDKKPSIVIYPEIIDQIFQVLEFSAAEYVAWQEWKMRLYELELRMHQQQTEREYQRKRRQQQQQMEGERQRECQRQQHQQQMQMQRERHRQREKVLEKEHQQQMQMQRERHRQRVKEQQQQIQMQRERHRQREKEQQQQNAKDNPARVGANRLDRKRRIVEGHKEAQARADSAWKQEVSWAVKRQRFDEKCCACIRKAASSGGMVRSTTSVA